MLRSQRQLRAQLIGGNPDRAAIDALLAELGAANMALERALVDNLLASRELLDTGQERRFLALMGRLRRLQQEAERRYGLDRRRWLEQRRPATAAPETDR